MTFPVDLIVVTGLIFNFVFVAIVALGGTTPDTEPEIKTS